MPSEPVIDSAASSDGAEAEVRSAESSESRPLSLWERVFGRRQETSGHELETTDSGDQPLDGTPPRATSQAPATLSQSEVEKLVQAETDRRERVRQERAAEEAKRKLRDEDPYAYVEQEKEAETRTASEQQFTGLVQSIAQQHDAVTLDVLLEALPATDRDRILKLEGAGTNLEGRKLIVSEGLKALQKHWKAEGVREAEARLRGDATVRKQLFHEFRGDVEEPELAVGTAANGKGDFMQQLQSEYRSMKGRRT